MTWLDKISQTAQSYRLSDFTRKAEVSVFLIHNSPDPEDYFFLFDFEEFAAAAKGGAFVTPKLRILAGRTDFDRRAFAVQFRQVFVQEFDQMRVDLAKAKNSKGWFGLKGFSISDFLANLMLDLALSTGGRILHLVKLVAAPDIFARKSKEQELLDDINKTKGRVDQALTEIAITMHPELYDHAYRFGHKGKNVDLDRTAWPLPQYVRQHFDDGTTGSRW